MSEWQGKSDFEINKAVAEAYQLEQGGFVKQSKTPTDDGYAYHYCDSVGVYSNIGEFCGVKDYCNNPSDAWPIIESFKCAFTSEGAYEPRTGVPYHNHENRLRAAMIVYLEMNGAKP